MIKPIPVTALAPVAIIKAVSEKKTWPQIIIELDNPVAIILVE